MYSQARETELTQRKEGIAVQEHLLNVSKQLCVFVILTALENIFWKNDITTSYSLKDPFCSLVKVFLVFFFSHLVVWVVVFVCFTSNSLLF